MDCSVVNCCTPPVQLYQHSSYICKEHHSNIILNASIHWINAHDCVCQCLLSCLLQCIVGAHGWWEACDISGWKPRAALGPSGELHQGHGEVHYFHNCCVSLLFSSLSAEAIILAHHINYIRHHVQFPNIFHLQFPLVFTETIQCL